MFTYKVRFRPFANAFGESIEVIADDMLTAKSMVLGLFPHGVIIRAELSTKDLPLAEVIYVDFKLGKRVA